MQKPTKRSRQEKGCARNQEVRLSMDPERRRPRRLLRRLKLNIRLLFIGETERFPKLMGGRFWRVDHCWQCIGEEGGAWTLSRAIFDSLGHKHCLALYVSGLIGPGDRKEHSADSRAGLRSVTLLHRARVWDAGPMEIELLGQVMLALRLFSRQSDKEPGPVASSGCPGWADEQDDLPRIRQTMS